MVVGACGGSSIKPIVLDGTPRFPSAEGVVQTVDVHHITLDGGRTYKVSSRLQSFSTYTLETVSLLQRKGQYVQVGLHGSTMTWISSIGAVVPLHPPVVFYNGRLLRTDASHHLIFRDGTVLRLGAGVTSPVATGFVTADIDPRQHLVLKVTQP